jgi:hypothetical protein
MTPALKRHHMLLLMRNMSATRSRFNSRLSTLRDQKRCLLVKLNGMRSQITDINFKLGINGAERMMHGLLIIRTDHLPNSHPP